MIKKHIILLILINFTLPYQGYDCEISKLSNISSNRALTTLKALGYYTIEHENVYVYDEWTKNLQPSEFDLENAGAFGVECELIPHDLMELISSKTNLVTSSLEEQRTAALSIILNNFRYIFGSKVELVTNNESRSRFLKSTKSLPKT